MSDMQGNTLSVAPAGRIGISVADLRDAASAMTHWPVPVTSAMTREPASAASLVRRSQIAAPNVSGRAVLLQQPTGDGTSEMLNLTDELFLVRTDWPAIPTAQRYRWEFDLRGWLYLHFRLDGASQEEDPNGLRTSLDGECFVLSASSDPRPFARELRSNAWRTVGIMCRPSFATRDLQISPATLPFGLQRLQSGEPDVSFWYADQLTHNMRCAVAALLTPEIRTSMRPVYLRAKAIELVCLALERLCRTELAGQRQLRLTRRDVECLQQARKLLQDPTQVPTLAELARSVGINRRKLAVGFKQIFGSTIGEYCRERRLELARSLLESRAGSVGYVAALVGYSDAGSFTKAFSARYGCVPSALATEIADPPAARRK